MIYFKQGLFLSILLLLTGCASTEVKQPAPKIPSMNDAEMKALLVGKKMHGITDGNRWTVDLKTDGTADGVYGGTDIDKGIYMIENNLYCSKWKRWGNGNKRCWSINKRAKGYYGKTVSGGGKSFTFTVK